MWKKVLLGLLGFSFVLYAAMSIACFVAPSFLLEQYQIEANSGTLFLGFVVGWFTVLLTAVCGYTFFLVRSGDSAGRVLSLILGLWCAIVGVAVYLGYGHADTLVSDTLRGVVLLLAAKKMKPAELKV